MGWTDADEAAKVRKFLKNGVLHPEDLTHNEIRLLREHHPRTYHFVRWWLETREEMIDNGEWTEDHEPPDTERRINRLDNGNSVATQYDDD